MHLRHDPIRRLPTGWLIALCGAAALMVVASPWLTGSAAGRELVCRLPSSAGVETSALAALPR